MNQMNLKVLNYPDPAAEELYVRKRVRALSMARQWGEAAVAAGLERLLSMRDRPACRDLIEKARARALVSPDGSDLVGWLAETCTGRITALTGPDAPEIRSMAAVLNDAARELFALRGAIDEILDLEEALRARDRLVPRT